MLTTTHRRWSLKSTPNPVFGFCSKEYEKFLTFQNGKTLRSVLSKKTYALLKKRLKEKGIPMSKIRKYKPWVLYLALDRIVNSDLEFRCDLGVESYFFQMARDAEKDTGGLETVQDQLNVFDKLSYKDQETVVT